MKITKQFAYLGSSSWKYYQNYGILDTKPWNKDTDRPDSETKSKASILILKGDSTLYVHILTFLKKRKVNKSLRKESKYMA